MAEAIDIRALNEKIERQSAFDVACHAVITWLSCTTHLADHAMIM